MTIRREVRVANVFFAQLDEQLGTERGPNGEPSATDFIVIELPSVVEEFAVAFNELPEALVGVSSVRMFIGTGSLVRAFVVHGIETNTGFVELVGVDIDLSL